METQPSEEELNKLPEALSLLANLIGSGVTPDKSALKRILSQAGLDGQVWALERLEVWSTILVRAHNDQDESEKNSIMAELQAQGMGIIRQGHAFFAYDKVRPRPISVNPEFIDLGLLDEGEGADRTLEVIGGTIKEVLSSKSLKVNPIKTSSGKTLIKVIVAGGRPGESLNGEIILRGDKNDECRVPVRARWKAKQEEPPLLSWCPDCADRIKKKSLFYNKTARKYECLNLDCKHEFPYPDKRVSQYNR